MSVPAQIAILLALNAALFDPVPLDRMAAAQRAVEDAAHALPDEVGERLAGAEALTDADRKHVTDAARQALAPFLTEKEPEPAPAESGPPVPNHEPKEAT